MASTIIENKNVTIESNKLEHKTDYYKNREKIDAIIWNDYIETGETPGHILVRLLERFRENWRFEPKRHKIMNDFF
jgi:hypothetical protein